MGREEVSIYNPTAFEEALSRKENLAIFCPKPKGLCVFFLQSCITRGFEQEHKSYTLILARILLRKYCFP